MANLFVHIPSTQEIHMIAYLTLHGWELSYEGMWTKNGFTHEVWDQDKDKLVDTEKFNLEDAYWAQKE